MAWHLVVAATDGTPIGELTAATQRKIVWPLNDVANVAFTIDGQHPQAQLPQELVTDLIVYDDGGTKRLRGRMGASSDNVAPSGEPAQLTATDYRSILGRRIDYVGPTFTLVDQARIAWELIEAAQALDGGYLGITPGVGWNGSAFDTGVSRTITNLAAGAYVADEINMLAALDAGFEWEIDANLKFNVWSPQRGSNQSGAAILEYGGTVVSFQRTYDPTKFANAVRFSGDGAAGVSSVEATNLPGPGSNPAVPAVGTPGRIDIAVSDSTIIDPSLVALRAQYELSQDENTPSGYQMILRSGWWSPEVCWIGDTVQLVLKSGRINEISQQRITQVEVDPGDDGGEVVTITTGPIPTDGGTDIDDQIRRLTLLELAG